MAFFDDLFERGKKVVDFLRRKYRRGFIQDDQACAAVEGFDDLYPLLFADRELPDVGFGFHFEAVIIAQQLRCVR